MIFFVIEFGLSNTINRSSLLKIKFPKKLLKFPVTHKMNNFALIAGAGVD